MLVQWRLTPGGEAAMVMHAVSTVRGPSYTVSMLPGVSGSLATRGNTCPVEGTMR